MVWSMFIREIGYLLTLIGTTFEGEITLMTSASMAAMGNLNVYVIFCIGILGVMIADNAWFYVGKKYGTTFMQRHTHLHERAQFVQRMLEKKQIVVVLLYRYAWGFRIITPVVLGTTSISQKRFFGYTIITSTLWATIFTSIGFFFGVQIAAVIAFVRSIQMALFVILAVIVGIYIYKTYEQDISKKVNESVNMSRKLHRKIIHNVRRQRQK